MPEYSKERCARDSTLIDVGRERECRYWSRKFGVSTERIREAVREVGPLAQYVERHLRDDAEIPRFA